MIWFHVPNVTDIIFHVPKISLKYCFISLQALVKTVKSFLHRRSNHGGHAGRGQGKRGLDFAAQKLMRRRLLWVLEALSGDKDLIDNM